MQTHTENKPVLGLRRAAVCGLIGTAVLLLTLMLVAALSGKFEVLLQQQQWTAKLCLLLSAILCGALSARGGETGKLPLALAGEAVLLLAVTAAVLFTGKSIFTLSWALDVVVLLLGAFVGAVSGGSGKRRRKKRK